MVVPEALPTARIRSVSQPWAAKRRDPVIVRLRIVRGAYKETADVSLRTPAFSVRTRAAGRPAASAVSPKAVRKALIGRSSIERSTCARASSARPAAGLSPHGGGMSRFAGSVLSTLCSSRIEETPSTKE